MRDASGAGRVVGVLVALLSVVGTSQADEDAAAAEGAARVARLIAELAAEHPLARRYAAHALGQRDVDATPAIPALFRALDDVDPDVRRVAASALGDLGEAAQQFLVAALEGNADDRLRAVRGLAHFQDSDTDRALAKHLHDEDPRVRLAVARELDARSELTDEARLVLAQGLSAPSPAWQDLALDAIAGAAAREHEGSRGFARPRPNSLVAVVACVVQTGALSAEGGLGEDLGISSYGERIHLDSPSPHVEPHARLEASVRVRRAVAALGRGLSAPDPWTRRVAAELLGELGDDGSAAAHALARATAEGRAGPRHAAAMALARMGRAAAVAVPALVRALEAERDGTTAVVAAWALGELGERARDAVPALIRVLDRHATAVVPYDHDVCLAAARALGRIGPAAAPSIPTLLRVLGSHQASPDGAEDEGARWGLEAAVEPAVVALGRIGPAAVTALLPLLTADGVPPLVRRRAARALAARTSDVAEDPAIPVLVRALDDSDALVRLYAIRALAPVALDVAAIPALARCLGDPGKEHRLAAQEALWRRGVRAVPALEEVLVAGPPTGRAGAARVLGLLGDEAVAAVPALVRALADLDPSVRREVGSALEVVGTRARFALLALLVEGEREARREAADALGRLGPDAVLAIPTLVLALVDPNEDVARAALGALVQIGEPATPALALAYREGGPLLRARAIEGLCERSAAAPASLNVLALGLGDSEEAIRDMVVQAMARWRGAALPTLRAVLGADDGRGHVGALAVLAELAKDETLTGSCRELVIAHLGVFGGRARRDAIWFVAGADWDQSGVGVEREVEAVVPALVAALDDDLDETREASRGLLARLGAVPALVDALGASSARARVAAAAALGEIGKAAAPAVSGLVAMLEDTDPVVAEGASEALGQIGAPAVDALIAALDAAERKTVAGAAAALSRMGAAGAPAIPRLDRLLHDADQELARLAVYPLVSIGGVARVRALAVDAAAPPEVRQAALAALRDEPASPETTATAVECLQADDPYTVVMGLQVLLSHTSRVDPSVLRRARHTEAEWVREVLEEALAVSGDLASARAVMARAGSSLQSWRYVGASHLTVLREDLERMFGDSSDRQRKEGILLAMGEIADPRSVPFLARTLCDPDAGADAGDALAVLVARRPEHLADALHAHAEATVRRASSRTFAYAWSKHASATARHEALRIGVAIAARHEGEAEFLAAWFGDLEHVAGMAGLVAPARTVEAWNAWVAQLPKGE